MTELGQKLYVKGQSAVNKLKRDEKGSTAVEFMGIAAVVVIVVVLISKWMRGSGNGLIANIFEGLFGGMAELIGKAFK